MKIKFESLIHDAPAYVTLNEETGALESDGSPLANMFLSDWDGTPKEFFEYFKSWQGGYYVATAE
jgi:hypothetical protein